MTLGTVIVYFEHKGMMPPGKARLKILLTVKGFSLGMLLGSFTSKATPAGNETVLL